MVVTNQSGIGRKIYDEAAMHAIHGRLQEDLGHLLDGFYFCPHLPGDGCACRKPNLGMLEAACSDLTSIWRVRGLSATKRSIRTGLKAGIRTALVRTATAAGY